MTELRFVQVDAFADRPFTGNPAAVMPLDAWLPDEMLQAIAMENNLAETAFTMPAADGEADYELRWFTPTIEVALCGHATLASGHVLIERRRDPLPHPQGRHARGRPRRRRADPRPARDPGPAPPTQADALLARARHAGRRSVFRSRARARRRRRSSCSTDEAAVRACAPDMARLRGDRPDGDRHRARRCGDGYDVVSRVFVPAWGVDEDPVTGSAHAALTPFWAERLGRDSFTAFQASRRGGMVDCRLAGDRAILGGKCVTVIEGVMTIDEPGGR